MDIKVLGSALKMLFKEDKFVPSFEVDNIGILYAGKKVLVFEGGILVYAINYPKQYINFDYLSEQHIDRDAFTFMLEENTPKGLTVPIHIPELLLDITQLLNHVIRYKTALGGWYFDGSVLRFCGKAMARYTKNTLTIYTAALPEYKSICASVRECIYTGCSTELFSDYESDIEFERSYGHELYQLAFVVSEGGECGFFKNVGGDIWYKGKVLYSRLNNLLDISTCRHNDWNIQDIKSILNVEVINGEQDF